MVTQKKQTRNLPHDWPLVCCKKVLRTWSNWRRDFVFSIAGVVKRGDLSGITLHLLFETTSIEEVVQQ
jgi:hypothetical protein